MGKTPVRLNELVDRDMIVVGVRDVASGRVFGHDNQRNARSVAKEIERLHISRVVIAAAFVCSHKNCSGAPELGILLDHGYDLFDEPFIQVPFR